MKNSGTQNQKILSYLYNEMTQDQRQQFENELNSDPELKKEFQLHREVDKAILTEVNVKEFREKMESIHQKTFPKKETKVIYLQNKWYWAAASVAIVSGSTYLTFLRNNKTPEDLYQKYYSVWQPALNTRGAISDSDFSKVSNLFESKNYEQTIRLIEDLSSDIQNSPNVILMKGCSLMELNKFDKALTEFGKFETKDYTLYTETAEWYQALCYLKTLNTDKAKTTLAAIIDSNSSFTKEAEALLKKME